MNFSFTHKIIAATVTVSLAPATVGIVHSVSSPGGSKPSVESKDSRIITVEQSENLSSEDLVIKDRLTSEEEQKLIEEYRQYKSFHDNFGKFVGFAKRFRKISSPLIKLARVAGVNISHTWIENFLKIYQQEKSQSNNLLDQEVRI